MMPCMHIVTNARLSTLFTRSSEKVEIEVVFPVASDVCTCRCVCVCVSACVCVCVGKKCYKTYYM